MQFLSKILAFFMSLIMTLFPFLFPENNIDKDYVTEGSSLVVNLDSNPSTGYTWDVEVSDESVIRFIRSECHQSDSLLGSSGRESFSFAGISEGKARIDFTYSQNWNKDPAASTAVFNVSVDEDGYVTVDSYKIN
ncbi:MAG: protease inhibitor I42 family protein [Acutalibacteraceae bacterium]